MSTPTRSMLHPPMMDQTAVDRSRTGGLGSALLRFTASQTLLVLLVAWLLRSFVWTDQASGHAITVSAWIALFIQTFTFTVARLVAQRDMIVGWGLGVLLRLAVVAFHAFFGVAAMSLLSEPALISLVAFFFVSTLVEPLFLN